MDLARELATVDSHQDQVEVTSTPFVDCLLAILGSLGEDLLPLQVRRHDSLIDGVV